MQITMMNLDLALQMFCYYLFILKFIQIKIIYVAQSFCLVSFFYVYYKSYSLHY